MSDENAFMGLYRQISGGSENEARSAFILHDALDLDASFAVPPKTAAPADAPLNHAESACVHDDTAKLAA